MVILQVVTASDQFAYFTEGELALARQVAGRRGAVIRRLDPAGCSIVPVVPVKVEVRKVSYKDLQKECKDLGLRATGKFEELKERLAKFKAESVTATIPAAPKARRKSVQKALTV